MSTALSSAALPRFLPRPSRLSPLLAAAVCLIGVAHAGQVDGLRIAAVDPVDGNAGFPGWSMQAPLPRNQTVDLELGDSLDGTVLTLTGVQNADDYRVWLQFETSLAIGAEGPHLDLLDWKHCVSAWKPLARDPQGGFLLPAPDDQEASCFPQASQAQIVAAARAALTAQGLDPADHAYWLQLAATVAEPGDAPSYVAISKIRLRVEQRAGDAWIEKSLIEFRQPMGC